MEKYYIFELNENVERKEVTYKNRYGLTIDAEIYTSKTLDSTKKYPAIIVGAPYGGVKEQGPGVYANELAQRGFVVLTFDQSFMGDSSGYPRHISSPEIFTENFSAAVDYLGVQSYVDRERIGVIGICGSGGFSLSAAAMDTRIKAVATASLYDMSYAHRDGLTKQQIMAMKDVLSRQRWVDFENGYPEYNPSFPVVPADSIPKDLPEEAKIWFEFYGLKRGHHMHARGGFTSTSSLSFLNVKLLEYIEEISPRPVLIIAGKNAHSLNYSEMVYENAAEPKELYLVDHAKHIDLYDDVNLIPFDKLEQFFKTNLK